MNSKLRIMAIGAHPDDCDIKAAATAVKFSRMGHSVKFISATNGDTGHYRIGGGELARIRYRETQDAAKIAGIEYEVFDIHNNGISPDIATREKFIKAIREFSPDILITHRPNDYHPDHRITSTLVQDSSYAIMIPNVLPLTKIMERPPVILSFEDRFNKPIPFNPDIIIDIDAEIDIKARILACHKSQFFDWLAYMNKNLETVPQDEEARLEWIKSETSLAKKPSVADRFRDKLIEKYGRERGGEVVWAEAFELSEYGRIPSAEELKELFPF